LIPISTIGEYLWDSIGYDPDRAWESALVKVIPVEKDRLALRKFFRTTMGTIVGGDPAPDLRQVFRAGVTAWRSGDMVKAAEVFEAEGAEIFSNYEYLTNNEISVPELLVDIKPWLTKYRLGGEALIGLGKVLRTCSYDKEKLIIVGPKDAPAKLVELITLMESNRKNLFGDQIVGPLNELAAELQTYSS
jgi:hypothetical protein